MTLADEFLIKKSIYDRCAAKVNSLLGELLNGAAIKIHHSGFRVKAESSLRGKLERKLNKYSSLNEITDLVGLRVITYYDDDVDRVASLIESEFVVDVENSIDKRKAYAPDRFGYMSLHYIASLGANRCLLPEYRDFSGIKFEIQIRTLLQHAWAEIEHDLGYKSNIEIPIEFRRKFSRVSSFLEEADESFVRIRKGIDKYSADSELKIREEGLLIDKVTLELLCDSNDLLRATDERVAEAFRAELLRDISPKLLEFLNYSGVSSTSELEEALDGHSDKVVLLAKIFQEQDDDRGYGSSKKVARGISVFLLCYIICYKRNGVASVVGWLNGFPELYDGENEDICNAVVKVCNQY